jgi:osmoprotectant transport system ATP-binding protein
MSQIEKDAETQADASIVFDSVSKVYPGQHAPALDEVSFTIHSGELVCLVGPSGGGKTTALQLVNRLVDISDGSIRIGGTDIREISKIELRRTIGYAIQNAGLFPHYTVEQNIGTVPLVLGWSKKRIRERVRELLELVGMTPVDEWLSRFPSQLSGGQQQRVGIARALAANPPVMLMDEPFGALDPITRTAVQDEFLRIHHEVNKTTMFVTHDIDEAVKMADRIAILKPGGKLAQFASPLEILTQPADEFVASFLGAERGLKRLSLLTMDQLVSHTKAPRESERIDAKSIDVSASLTAREALSLASAEACDLLRVVDNSTGETLGIVSVADVVSPPGEAEAQVMHV